MCWACVLLAFTKRWYTVAFSMSQHQSAIYPSNTEPIDGQERLRLGRLRLFIIQYEHGHRQRGPPLPPSSHQYQWVSLSLTTSSLNSSSSGTSFVNLSEVFSQRRARPDILPQPHSHRKAKEVKVDHQSVGRDPSAALPCLIDRIATH